MLTAHFQTILEDTNLVESVARFLIAENVVAPVAPDGRQGLN